MNWAVVELVIFTYKTHLTSSKGGKLILSNWI